MSPFLPNGIYAISNAQFTTQYANLLGGEPSSNVGGYHELDSNSKWQLENVGYEEGKYLFTLTSEGTRADKAYIFAGPPTPGVVPHGNPNPTIWIVLPASGENQYRIVPYERENLFWTLSSGEDGATITLEKKASGDSRLTQVWTFEDLSQAEDTAWWA